MKRILVTILAIFYLGVSSGATLQFHYCMGKLVDWELSSKISEKCDKCGMKKGSTKDCCKTSEKQFKVDNSHKASGNDFLLKVSTTDLLFSGYALNNQIVVFSNTSDHPFANAPPGLSDVSVFLRNCNFRI